MYSWIKNYVTSLFATTLIIATSSMVQAAPSADDQKVIDAQKKTYPLTNCVVSGEKLEKTSMGEPVDYLYKTKDKDGKETVRLVRFCCTMCVKKFNADPARYLKKIDDAQASKPRTSAAPATPAASATPVASAATSGDCCGALGM